MIKRSGRMDLPFTGVSGNVIYGRGAVAAVYRVDTTSYAFLSNAEKEKIHARMAWWMLKAESDFSIYRVCREYPVDAYVDDVVSMLDERHGDRTIWERSLTEQAERMRSLQSFVPEVYVVVRLRPSSRKPWSRSTTDSRIVRDAERAALQTLSDQLSAQRATTLEIQWLLRRATVRGVCEPDVDPHWAPPALTIQGGVWEPTRNDVQPFVAAVTEHGRSVRVEGTDGESLQSFLSLGPAPAASEFPGANAELMFAPLETLDFPVDAVMHVRWVSNKKMQSRCDDAARDADNAIEDAAARLLDKRTHRRAEEASEAQDYFSAEPFPPGLYVSASFAVGANDEETLNERAQRLDRAYGSVRTYRSHALQRMLYEDHMLRPDGATVTDYQRLYTREQLAATMPLGSHHAGSQTGIYIGYTIPGAARPIRYDVLEASAMNRAGAILMDGTLGAGKSIGSQRITVDAANRGSLVVDIDPKPDHSLEDLLPDVHVVSLSDIEGNRGLLDPLVVAPPEMREELGSSYMMEILPSAKPEWQTEIIDAVRATLREKRPSSLRVIERLLASEDEHAYAAGKALRVWSQWGLGKLAFGDGTRDVDDVAHQVTTIKASALTLPPAGTPRMNYDQSERLSVATLKLIAAYAMRLISGDRSVHKLLVLDEAHVLTSTADGRRFLERLIRMGRALNVTVLLSTQLLGDLGELLELIGVRFSFRQETEAQARINLRLHGLDESNEKLTSMLMDFDSGCCLMSGLDRRVAAMRFDVGEEFLRVSDTNPTRIPIAELERQVVT